MTEHDLTAVLGVDKALGQRRLAREVRRHRQPEPGLGSAEPYRQFLEPFIAGYYG